MGYSWTEFMPLQTRRILVLHVPTCLAKIIVDMARDAFLPPWDPYGSWAHATPEYDCEGSYGHLPMVDTYLPLF